MIKKFIAVIMLVPLALGVLAFHQPPLHYRLASDTSIKGKGVDGECCDYALALSSKLAANGIHGHLIWFRWHIQKTNISGSHVFVFYHADDKDYVVDNEQPHPKIVSADETPIQLIYSLATREDAHVDIELQEGLNHLSYF